MARICDGVSLDRSGMPFAPMGGMPPADMPPPGRAPAPPLAAAILPILRVGPESVHMPQRKSAIPRR